MSKLRVLIAEYDSSLRGELRELAGSYDKCEIVGMARDGHEALQMALQLSPDMALIPQDLRGISGLQACEMLTALAPGIMTVIVADAKSSTFAESAMRAGARAVVARPLDSKALHAVMEQLSEILERRTSPEYMEWKDPSRFPKVVSVTGAKGGVGKSTIVVNLAALLARRMPDKIALIDLYTQYGDIATMLNLTPKRTISELDGVGGDLDAGMLQSYVTRHSSGLHVFVAATTPLPLDAVSGECLDNLLHVMKRHYRCILVDVPPILHEPTLHVLGHSNLVCLVGNLFDITTATDTKRAYDSLLSEHISPENIKIILNRVSKSNRLKASEDRKSVV